MLTYSFKTSLSDAQYVTVYWLWMGTETGRPQRAEPTLPGGEFTDRVETQRTGSQHRSSWSAGCRCRLLVTTAESLLIADERLFQIHFNSKQNEITVPIP